MNWLRQFAVAAAIVAACAAAASQGLRATRGLEWPGDPDLARDIAVAETAAAGHPLSDPYYRGEWAWYNPLVPWGVAAAANASAEPIPILYARAGAYLNLAAPLALVALVSLWWGPYVGLGTLFAFLFLVPGNDPGWLAATYSPWLFPMHVGQAIFYLALIATAAAWNRERSMLTFAAAGVAAGALFLTHTAPALLLGIAMAVEVVRRLRQRNRGRVFANSAVCLAAAVIVASPFLASIIGHYRLHILNPAPLAFVAPELALENAPAFWARALSPSIHGLIALNGFVWLVRDRHRLESRMILSCAAAAIVLLGYSYVVQTEMAQSVGRYGIVPGHHFVYYLRAFEAIAFGLGLRALVEWLQHRQGEQRSWWATEAAWVVVLLAVAAIVVWRYPSYAARSDFVFERRVAERNFSDPSLRQLYVWLREHTSPQDVVLAPVNTGQYVVGVAGRKVVVVDKLFSNPYVDWGGRANDRDVMEKALADGDWNSFLEVASRHKIRYVLRRGELTASPNTQLLSSVWSQGEWVLYRLGS